MHQIITLMTSGIVIPLIKTQVDWRELSRCGLGALDNNGLQSRVQKLGIMDVGSRHNHTQGAACLFHKNAPLGPRFASISGISTNHVPPKRALTIAASAPFRGRANSPHSTPDNDTG